MAELILYATPQGELADACHRFFAAANELRPTTAQTYPPHCTLTGFFHRSPDDIARIVEELARVTPSGGWVPDDAVSVVELHHHDSWTGLEISSTWLHHLVQLFVDEHELGQGDDALRPKDWLHLSLAYGVDDLSPYRGLADELIDPSLPATWRVALWERRPNREWTTRS